ncbi:uncharacterized protein [Garra rufa]|uniref:uncharacterized protein n=1 Tax=Garra rufa TaxID=137080 RepID=UPI003CCE8778
MTKVQEELKKQWEKMIKASNQSLKAEDFDIYVLDMGFGVVGNEPIDNVHFYSKNDLKTGFKLEKYQVSSLKPKRFHEFLVRVYYNKTDGSYQDVQQTAEESFHKWCKENEFIDSGNDETVRELLQNSQPSLGKIFNDPIYGQTELDPFLLKIIDTPQFQRLRHIKQLGGTYLVYPGATHTRFEHSLGMAYLAGQMINILKEKQADLSIDEKDIMCVQIAALCYNLGHGPFSHLYERFYYDAPKREGCGDDRSGSGQGKRKDQAKTVKSENWKGASVLILKDIIKNNEELKDKIQEKDIIFIQELIEGVYTEDECKAKSRTKDKAFLYDIVINKWNGIDVRRWDYFARDCHYLGIPNSFDHQRMLKSARVCEVEGRKHICFRDKVADNVYDMFRTQYTLYSQAYQHKIVNIIEKKIAEALSAAEDKIPKISPFAETPSRDDSQQRSGSQKRTKALASDEERVAKMSKLTDNIFEEILYSTDDKLKDARMILEDVVRRRLPKCVGETRITQNELKNKQILQDDWNEAVDEWNKLYPTVFLDKKDFSVDGASVLILKDIIKNNEELKDKIQEKDIIFIQELIEGVYTDGKWKAKGRKKDKAFLYEIVINKWNGIDVRRWDYFARDCHYLGIPNSFDHQRMLKSARVCEVKGRKHICFRDKVADNVYDMFRTQYTLYSQAYQHKIVNIIEKKITEALSAAEDKIPKISPFAETPSQDESLQRSGSRKRTKAPASDEERVAKMSKLTDHIFEEILYSTDDKLKDARMILEDVVRRRLPKCVGETRITQNKFKNKQILQNKILVYDEEKMKGNKRLITKDCASLDCCGIKAIRSCKVLSGVWNLYDCRNYSEPEYTLQPGTEYHNPTKWGALDRTAPALSLRHERK